MQHFIAINQSVLNGQSQSSVDARELHIKLGSNQDFSTWIRNRIETYGFMEKQDFVSFAPQNHGAKKWFGRGGHNRIEYTLTLDMAKELAMVERSEKGRQIRRYFIDVEKQYRLEKEPSLEVATLPKEDNTISLDKDEYIALLRQQNSLLSNQQSKKTIRRPYTNKEKLQIEQLRLSGYSPAQIGKQLGRTRSAINSYFYNKKIKSAGVSDEPSF